MEASDMLDVIHYFFEEDMHVSAEGEAEAKSEVRSIIYSSLYGSTYKYAIKTKGRSYAADGSNYPSDGLMGEDLTPFDPEQTITKPFIPATDFDAESPLPFGRDLDAPLG